MNPLSRSRSIDQSAQVSDLFAEEEAIGLGPRLQKIRSTPSFPSSQQPAQPQKKSWFSKFRRNNNGSGGQEIANVLNSAEKKLEKVESTMLHHNKDKPISRRQSVSSVQTVVPNSASKDETDLNGMFFVVVVGNKPHQKSMRFFC